MPETITAPANGQTLASQYDIHDPVYEYSIPDIATPAAGAPATPLAPQPSSTTTQPAGPTPLVTPVTPAPAPSTPQKRHPTWLLQNAADLGINPLIIQRLETPELTEYVMGELSRWRQNAAQNQVAAAVTTPSAQPQAAAVAPAAPANTGWDWGIHDDEDHLDSAGRPTKKQYQDSDFNPAFAWHIKEQARRIAELEKAIAGMNQSVQNSQQNHINAQFDAAFNKLGGIFGVGTGKQLKGQPEFDKRATVFSAVRGMMQTLPPHVAEAMTIEQAVFSMAKSMFGIDTGGLAAAATPSNDRPTPEQFRTGVVQPPTDRRPSIDGPGRDKAIAEAQKWWSDSQASGAIPQNGGTSMDEFLPIR